MKMLRLLICVLFLSRFHAGFADSMSISVQPYMPAEQNMPGDAQALWDEYVFNTVATRTLQNGCEPMQVRPPSRAAYRGVIILLHGFTSCPKQYNAMAAELSQLGYHVLLPLLPGHGGLADNELDAQTFLPRTNNWFNYDAFARWLNKLAGSIAQGEVHIGGLCLGGTVAMRSLQLAPHLYKSSVLFSPFFEVSARLLGRIGRLLGRVTDVLNIRNGFELPIALQDEEICQGIERDQLGRVGYCRTRLTNLIAVARFAHFVKVNSKPLSVPVQTMIVANDPVAHPEVTISLVEANLTLGPTRNALCVMNESASHSFFSTTDLPMPKPWLPQLHLQLGRFFQRSEFLQSGESSSYSWSRAGRSVASCALWP